MKKKQEEMRKRFRTVLLNISVNMNLFGFPS